ncbi:nitric oxide synthase-like protein [Artemia franciscana]|uniref:nitric oxide synthase-like protein n=1 Tax=Artemia franciscana TaxID=6661 RepID=UPI0032DBCF67
MRGPLVKLPSQRFEDPAQIVKSSDWLINVRFSCFALGSTVYKDYCAFGKALDALLGSLGAERIHRLECGDEMSGQEKTFKKWANDTFQAACEAFHIKLPTKAVVTIGTESVQEPVQSNMKLVSADASEGPHFTEYFSKSLGREVLPLKVTYNEVIAGSREAGPCTVQIRLSWQDLCLNNPVSFEPGDHLGILSENADEMVSKVIQKLNPIPSLEQTHRLMIQKEMLTIAGPRKEWVCYENLPPATVFDWFKKFLDITTPPTQSLLYDLATYATDPKEKEGLDMLSQDVGRYEQWKHSKWPTVLSFLEEFSLLSIPAEALIIKLPLMKPRFYSISSCLLSSPTCVDLTVGAVKFITEGEQFHH